MRLQYKTLLTEIGETGVDHSTPRTSVITQEQALKYIQTKCKKTFNSGVRMYRGLDNSKPFLLTNPSAGGERTSANTANYYTWLIDHLDSWKEYPKRSKSIICSTDPKRTEDFGETYHVFPFDGAKIGICSSDDLWVSFGNVKHFGGEDAFDDMNMFNYNMSAMFHTMDELLAGGDGSGWDDDYGGYEYADSWEEFRDALTRLSMYQDQGLFKRLNDLPTNKRPAFYKLLQNRHKGEAISSFFDRIMGPKKNGFTLVKTGAVNSLPHEREVWTEGPAVLISFGLDLSTLGKEWVSWKKYI